MASSPPPLDVRARVRSWARAHAASRATDIASRDDLAFAAALLTRQPLNYDMYCLVRDHLPPKISRLMTASLFARVRGEGGGRHWTAHRPRLPLRRPRPPPLLLTLASRLARSPRTRSCRAARTTSWRPPCSCATCATA